MKVKDLRDGKIHEFCSNIMASSQGGGYMVSDGRPGEVFIPKEHAQVLDNHPETGKSNRFDDEPRPLEPCPFCGGAAESTELDDREVVACTKCKIGTVVYSAGGATKVWNERVLHGASPCDKGGKG